eukprot:PhF_6_TR10978/c0_g2_i7/m.17733
MRILSYTIRSCINSHPRSHTCDRKPVIPREGESKVRCLFCDNVYCADHVEGPQIGCDCRDGAEPRQPRKLHLPKLLSKVSKFIDLSPEVVECRMCPLQIHEGANRHVLVDAL